jgi:hypothetical protein
MALAEHVVVRVHAGPAWRPRPADVAWIWARFQRAFPDALACLCMPDHVHVVARAGQRPRLTPVLGALVKRFGRRFEAGDPQVANTPAIAARMVRYAFLNPVRGGLVDDPWEWRWSTLRDLGGATYPTWTDRAALARLLHLHPSALLRQLTETADHRPPPLASRSPDLASTMGVREAVAAALRLPTECVLGSDLGRRLTVQACIAIGDPKVRVLAAKLGVCERTIRRNRSPRHPALDCVLQCLADPRLSKVVTERSGGPRTAW